MAYDGERIQVNVRAGTLAQLQAVEELVGLPVDKWGDAPRGAVLVGVLVVYGDVPLDEAKALSIDEAMARVDLSNMGGTAPNA